MKWYKWTCAWLDVASGLACILTLGYCTPMWSMKRKLKTMRRMAQQVGPDHFEEALGRATASAKRMVKP